MYANAYSSSWIKASIKGLAQIGNLISKFEYLKLLKNLRICVRCFVNSALGLGEPTHQATYSNSQILGDFKRDFKGKSLFNGELVSLGH